MRHLAHGRTILVVVIILVLAGATSAGAAKLITGSDVKNGSLTGKDVKQGSLTGKDVKNDSIPKKKLKMGLRNAIPIRVAGVLPSQGFTATNDTVSNTADGVEFGPYANGGAAGGSVCSSALNGQPLSDVQHLAYEARYTADGDTVPAGVAAPYLRIFLEGDTADAIFSPSTQQPDPDTAEGPFHTWVATAGTWRYNDDSGTGPDVPFEELRQAHAAEVISRICITTGFTGGTNLAALLRTWEINKSDYALGQ